MGSTVLTEGANMTKMSLPVALFEPRSFLERLTDNWCYMDLLAAAADSRDPVDRLRHVVAFAVSGLCRNNSFGKPFNPILGETLQATYSSGVEVFCEQTAHHPPVSSWEVIHPSGLFEFTGTGTWSASFAANSVKGHQAGAHRVKFASDGAVVTWNLPYVYVSGVLWGDRVVSYAGEMVFEDDLNGLRCHVDISRGGGGGGFMFGLFGGGAMDKAGKPKGCAVSGAIHRVAPAGRAAPGASQSSTSSAKGAGKAALGEKLDQCEGSWLSDWEWERGPRGKEAGGRRYWDRATAVPRVALPVPGPLPSDSRFREDLVALKVQQKMIAGGRGMLFIRSPRRGPSRAACGPDV